MTDIDQLRDIIRRDTDGRRLCSLPFCDNPHRARGMCIAHYRQWERSRTVTPIDPTLAARPKPTPTPQPPPRLPAWLNLERLAHTTPQPGWQRHGACAGKPQDWFFPNRGQSTTRAKKVCASCPVRYPCLADALTQSPDSDHGVRGGTSVRQRLRIRTQLAQRSPA